MSAAAGHRTSQESTTTRTAVAVFLIFAFSYFISALVRGVTATLAPLFTTELGLTAGDLGLLGGAFFLGFASTQLPLGTALDRHGPKRVQLAFLAVAVVGSVAFALARDFVSLAAARALIGVGVSACLMAPLTAFRRSFDTVAQLRANSWMLMSGSVGMVASTLPVQWLLPLIGWRGLFWAVAGWMLLSMVAIARFVPADAPAAPRSAATADPGYAAVWRHPTFVRLAPMGFFHYGGLIAVQSLWAGPWLVEVCGWTAPEAAQGLFAINVAMLLSFMAWGGVVPRLFARGWSAQRLIACGAPFSLAALALALVLGPRAGAWVWVLFSVGCTVVSLSQPAVGLALPAALAGRALSAYNLVIFLGVFTVQWGIGLAIDGLRAAGWETLSAFRGGFALLAGCCLFSYVWFLCRAEPTATPKLNQLP
ncbi:MAG: MFS transporter [Rhizobiales bacterium]|nr:MFS transporter [Rhizobacter sp.]